MTMYKYAIACYTIMDIIWQSAFYMNHREVFYDIKIEAIWLYASLNWPLLGACTINNFKSNLKRFWWVDEDIGNLLRLKLMTILWTQSSYHFKSRRLNWSSQIHYDETYATNNIVILIVIIVTI